MGMSPQEARDFAAYQEGFATLKAHFGELALSNGHTVSRELELLDGIVHAVTKMTRFYRAHEAETYDAHIHHMLHQPTPPPPQGTA